MEVEVEANVETEVEANDAAVENGPGMGIDEEDEDVSDEDALEEEVAEGMYDATPKT